jgi:poly(hydroxyalkanoate) depolymerase family esterase
MLAFVTSSLFAQSDLKEVESFGANPGNLRMYLYSPQNVIDTIGDMPLVIVLHGCNQDAKSIAEQTGWNKLADQRYFYVLYVEQKRGNNPSKCFNWYQLKDVSRGNGEITSIKSMMGYTLKNHPIDASRVFVYGLSAGAASSVALLANYPNLFKAGAIFAGAPFMAAAHSYNALNAMKNPKNKSPEEWGKLVTKINTGYTGTYPKLIVAHGTKDRVVSFNNSIELIDQWSYLHKIEIDSAHVVTAFEGHEDLTKKTWLNSNNKAVIQFYQMKGLGHSLAIDPGEGINQGGKTGLFATDTGFHSTAMIANDFGL